MWFCKLINGLSRLFDRLIQVVIKVRCRVNCCSKKLDTVTIPDKKISIDSTDNFKSLD